VSEPHRILARQLRRLGIDTTAPPDPAQWAALLDRVNAAYEDADQSRYLVERSLEVSSREMRQLYDDLEASRNRQATVFETASVGLCVVDRSGVIEAVNPVAAAMMATNEECLVGRLLWEIVTIAVDRHPDDVLDAEAFEHVIMMDRPWHYDESTVSFADGTTISASCILTPMQSDLGPTGAVLVIRDTTDLRAAVDRLAWQASHDPLTGLANRKALGDILSTAIRRPSAAAGRLWVIYLDLDRFKLVNDVLGHAAGDELLLQVVQRIGSVIRPGDVLARLAGDEFVVVCEGPPDEAGAVTAAERIIEAIERPFTIRGLEAGVSASIGIAKVQPGTNPAGLLREADTAMYRAKAEGRSCVRIFDQALRKASGERLEAEADLRRLVKGPGLDCAFQAQVELATARTVGYEVLARWPEGEPRRQTPLQFIELAEEIGLISDLGRRILAQACVAMATGAVGPGMTLSINVSGRELAQRDYADRVLSSLQSFGVAASALTVEVTESVLVGDSGAVQQLARLRAAGVGVSVDDFGTGYSSLSNLRRLPVSELKLDRAFVSVIHRSPEDRALAAAVVELGHALGMVVLAEGVETATQADMLASIGCDRAQGYLFARPSAEPTPAALSAASLN
jgi:diguanylate cyclase (GGDEF)-like protein/PAS domain S-box-containing protein